MREAYIEKKVCDYAQKHGWLVYKFCSVANRGVPDRILIRNGIVIFIEFKSTGKQLNALQEHVAGSIMNHGCDVYTIDSVDDGKKLIDERS